MSVDTSSHTGSTTDSATVDASLQTEAQSARRLHTSVRGKFIGIVLATTLLVLVISGAAMLIHDLSVYRTSWASDVASEASILALSTAPALAFDDHQAAERNLSALQTRSAVLAAALYSDDNKLYAQYVRAAETPPPTQTPSGIDGLEVNGEHVELLQRIVYKGEYLGTLYVRAHYDVIGRIKTYLGIFSVITLLSLIAALMLSSLLQRLITVPIEEIGEVARQIVDKHDYSLRVEKRTDDEIGLVVQALNGMLNEVETRTRELEKSNAALLEADQRKDEFLATLAHELRNPLAPIRHATRILEASNAGESQRKWGREVIARQVEHMALLLDDLLDVSRITRGRLGLKKDYVTLEKIISSAVETARPLIDSKKHELRVQIPSESVDLNVDSLRMSQVISNLLTNAAKYTDAGGTITLRAQREAAGIIITVQDTGIGISASAMPKVFEMFSQVESALERSQGGLGIGLALVKGLVVLHGGTVDVHSEGLGHGSTFIVRLPNACVFEHIYAPTQSTAVDVSVKGPRCKVLVADDNRDAAESLAMLLNVLGYEVIVAHSGQEVMELAPHAKVDAFILDIGMPKMSGYDVAKWIREQSWGKSVLVMALTGWGQREDVARARDSGFDRHFTKPVDGVELERVLAEFSVARCKSPKSISVAPELHGHVSH